MNVNNLTKDWLLVLVIVYIDYLVNGNSKSNQFRISRKFYCFNYIGATTSTDKKYIVDFSIIV